MAAHIDAAWETLDVKAPHAGAVIGGKRQAWDSRNWYILRSEYYAADATEAGRQILDLGIQPPYRK